MTPDAFELLVLKPFLLKLKSCNRKYRVELCDGTVKWLSEEANRQFQIFMINAANKEL